MANPILSMTGYATRSFSVLGQNYKIELKSLNHRFLDQKLRLPREWNGFDGPLKSLVESKVKRGAIEVWVERQADQSGDSGASENRINYKQAEVAHQVLTELQKRFGLAEAITLRDLISFPEVLSKTSAPVLTDEQASELKSTLLAQASLALDDLVKMRILEGSKLQAALLAIIDQFRTSHDRFVSLRDQLQKKSQEKIRKRIEQCFEAYATPDAQMRALMETRIAQEISYALDKADIEEELTRFKGHIDEIANLLKQGGPVGKKLDFMFQELNREINTLGNKAQDLDVSQDVISLKMWIEQMREQSLNLE